MPLNHLRVVQQVANFNDNAQLRRAVSVRYSANTIKPSVRGDDAALRKITLAMHLHVLLRESGFAANSSNASNQQSLSQL